jgi:endonuclease YncB( thermonuclease family)
MSPAMQARIVRLLGLGACIVAIFVALIVAQRFAPVPEVPDARAPAIPAAPQPASVAESPVGAPAVPERTVRDVTPSGVSRVFMPPAVPAKRKAPASMQITHAGVKPDGAIVGEGGAVRLYGVTFPEPKQICRGASGESWPCGRRAYITLHNRIAAETVSCEPRAGAERAPEGATADPPAADCYVGSLNLAEWMLAQGLARLAAQVADDALIAAEAGARKARIGLWADPADPAPMSAQRQ